MHAGFRLALAKRVPILGQGRELQGHGVDPLLRSFVAVCSCTALAMSPCMPRMRPMIDETSVIAAVTFRT
jgi:hypothetical protein